MTLAELRRWALSRNWGQRQRAALESHLEQFTVDWPDDTLCSQWAQVMVQADRAGRPMSSGDAWQAATALVNGVPLVTHNRRHFSGVANLVLITEAPV
jgi:predicted nucleic acid-binding protein